MKVRTVLLSIMFVGLLLLVVGCGKEPESTQSVDSGVVPASGKTIRHLSLKSDRDFFNEKQSDVSLKLTEAINNGHYNVVSVQTSYTDGYLMSADVIYDSSGRGVGNDLRVMLIQSTRYYYDQKQDDVLSKLDTAVNSGQYDIVKVQATKVSGYTVAAEVYYRQ